MRDHLSMGLLNSLWGTGLSPTDTLLVSRLPFVNYCVVTKQRTKVLLDWVALYSLSNFNFFASTEGFNTEDSCFQSQEFEKLIKDVLLRSILSFGVWHVYHEQLRANTRVIFFDFFFLKIVLEILGCGLSKSAAFYEKLLATQCFVFTSPLKWRDRAQSKQNFFAQWSAFCQD